MDIQDNTANEVEGERNTMKDGTVNRISIEEAIKEIRSGKSDGHDKITSEMLKNVG